MGRAFVIPATNLSYYTDAQAKANEAIVTRIKTAPYFANLQKYCRIENLPIELVIAVVATESGGRELGKNPYGAVGLMQVKKIAAFEAIRRASIANELDAQEKAWIKTKSPEISKNDFKIKYGSLEGVDVEKAKTELEAALFDTEFNIFIGTMLLGQAIDSYTEGKDQIYLSKAIAIYNQGSGSRTKIKDYDNATDIIEKSTLGTEGKNYIKKILGKNGYVHIQKPKIINL